MTAQLIEASTDQYLWADNFDRELRDILSLYSDVARAIAQEIEIAVMPEEETRLASVRPVDPEAHDAYLKGSYHWQKLTPEDLDTAESYFELALARDPSYAPAYEGLYYVWGSRQQMGITPPHEAGPKAKSAALQAVALDDSSAGAHEALAGMRTWTDWDWAGSEVEWRRALELDPNRALTHAAFAHFLAITGRIDEAIPHSERAIELDPFNAMFHSFYAMVLCGSRRYDDAIATARTAQAMQPDEPVARSALCCAFASKGMRDEHLVVHREDIARDPKLVAAFEQGLVETGYEGTHRCVADLMAARYERSGGTRDIAHWYLFAGDYSRSIDWLEKDFEVRNPNLPYVSFLPIWDPLRDDPRFQDLLRRMNLPVQ